MAVMYLKTGSTNWTAAASWSAVNAAGADSVGPPLASTDCIAEALSGAVTIDSGAVCRSLNCTSGTGIYNNTITHSAAVIWTIGDGTAGAGNVALNFSTTTTYTISNATTSAITWASSSSTQQTINYQGATVGDQTYNTANQNYKYTGNFTHGATSRITQNRGTVDFNNITCTIGLYLCSAANAKTIALNAGNITISGVGGNACNFGGGFNTVTNSSSTITFTGASPTFATGGLTFGNITHNVAGASGLIITGVLNCVNYTRTGTAISTDTATFSSNVTCSGTFKAYGNSNSLPLLVTSGTVGTPITISAAVLDLQDVDFRDITAAGAGTWSGTRVGNFMGNTGITFATPRTIYNRATGNFSVDANWSTTTGGSSDTIAPRCGDTIKLDGNTPAAVTNDLARLGNLDCTGLTKQMTQGACSWTGNWILANGMTFAGTPTQTFVGRGAQTLTYNTKGVSSGTTIDCVTGTYTLQDDYTSNRNITTSINVVTGTFDANNKNITLNSASSGATIGASGICNAGNGTWSFGATAAVTFLTVTAGSTFNAQGSTILLSAASASTRTLAGGAHSFNIITYTVAGSTGELDIGNFNTITTINFSDASNARTITFTNGGTTTITNINIFGTATKLMTIQGAAGVATISKSSGRIFTPYCNIANITCTGGALWFAGLTSTDGGGNTNIRFADQPSMMPLAGVGI